ncbi:hypothetical protein Raf01_88490 [Rugosimonospora africana]|uniref:Uncharacterized protein n=1 Tax=Rugosimonospora africana TaxID=556532 RepID=A0A8J3R2I3_9ACTN|nr:hypothetical protein Raf01_88490 [Rugosimonospora africana]
MELDRAVVRAERGFDVALVVLASVMPVDQAAAVAGVDVAVFRAARRRGGAAEVRAAVARLGVGRGGGRRRTVSGGAAGVGDGVGAAAGPG